MASTLPDSNSYAVWKAGTAYPPGSVIRPLSTPGANPSAPNNPSFETGDFTGWTTGTGFNVSSSGLVYAGTYSANLAGGSGTQTLVNTNKVAVIPGQTINASCYINLDAYATGQASGNVTITWYDSGSSVISTSVGTPQKGRLVPPAGTPAWYQSGLHGVAPATAAFAAIGCTCSNTGGTTIWIDLFAWDYLTPTNAPQFIFYAVQAATAKSGGTEPVWAITPPNIVDGPFGLIWSSQQPTRITWTAVPLLQSGGSEPTWPVVSGQSVHDGTMDWVAVTPQITDSNCPQSPYVMIASSKIFAADNDIVRFSATTDPTDWTSAADAGFLPVGLQTYGKNPFQAIGLYRSNGVFFNAEGLQMWQLDEDPANMALLDAIPVGSTRQRALAPVNSDLFFLSTQGVRTMGISAGSGNLQAGDVGMPIDPLVQAAMTWADANNVPAIGAYFPSAGQYWLAFPDWPATGLFVDPGGTGQTNIFVYTMNRIGEVGAWSRYLIPVVMQDFAQFGNDLYIRALNSGNQIILKVVQDGTSDLQPPFAGSLFTSIIQWPWLDDGQPGQTKQLCGVDFSLTFANSGSYTFQVGYDQSDPTAFTTACTLTGDTVPGFIIPIPVMGPSFSLRMTLTSDTDWQIQSAYLYLQDQRLTS